jgi:hypothetical protein
VVGPVNLTLHSLFANVEMEVKEKLVTDPSQLYPYRAFLETLTNYNKDVLKTRHYAEGWTKDTAGQLEVSDPAGANTGLGERATRFNQSAVVNLMGRLHLDLFHQDKTMPGNVPIRIRLIPQNSRFLLKTAAPDANHPQENFKILITSARLYVRTKKLSPQLVLAHQQMLQENNYVIHYTKVAMKKYTIPQNSFTANFNAIYQGQLPDRVLVCFVRDDAVTGSYQLNPFNLDTYNINFMCMTVNGESFPKVALSPNYRNGDYIREYMVNLAEMGYDTGPNCLDLTPAEWTRGFHFVVFKLTPGPIGTIRTPARAGVANLEVKFGTATPHNISMICMEQHDAALEIDKFANVILS